MEMFTATEWVTQREGEGTGGQISLLPTFSGHSSLRPIIYLPPPENCKQYNAVSRRLRDGFARHLISLCRPYVVQMQRNELKYACFPRIYLSILHK